MGAAGGLEWARLTRFWPGGVSMWARGGVSHHARSWHLPLFPSPQPHAPFALLCASHGVRPGEALPVARAAAARAMAALRGGGPVMVSCSGGRSPLTFEVARGCSAGARSVALVACAEGGPWLPLAGSGRAGRPRRWPRCALLRVRVGVTHARTVPPPGLSHTVVVTIGSLWWGAQHGP